jgi:transposase-like protein
MTMTITSLDNHADTDVMEGTPVAGARARRRTFTAAYKARILDEYDVLPAGGEQRGSLLRREGLCSSHIAEWRKARDAGARKGLKAKGKPKRTAEQVELDKLRRRDKQLQTELKRTRLALQITREEQALLEILWACHSICASSGPSDIEPSLGLAEGMFCDEDEGMFCDEDDAVAG